MTRNRQNLPRNGLFHKKDCTPLLKISIFFEVDPLDLCQIYREPQAGIFHPFALNPLEIHVFSWNIPLTFSTEGDAIFLTILDRLEYKG